MKIVGLCALAGGCSKETFPLEFEPNLVQTMRYQIKEDLPMDQASEDSTWIVNTMFGTPDLPLLPEVVKQDSDLSQVVSEQHLLRASGPEDMEGRGIYRMLCAGCHGITGNGRGLRAEAQNPYPRDYRMGVFKFKSTPRSKKPTKADLKRLIKHGIAGTNMKSVNGLLEDERLLRQNPSWMPESISDEDVDALVDYVIYLAWRGELERKQIEAAIFEGIFEEEGGRLIDSDYGRKVGWNKRDSREATESAIDELMDQDDDELTESEKEERDRGDQFLEEWGYSDDLVQEIGEDWLDAEDEVIEVPDPPTDLPLAESYADVETILQSDQAEAFRDSIARGQKLFTGKLANCSKCHGEKGLGDGQTTDFDDWTKDWLDGLNPKDFDSLVPLLARGALKPRNAMPRNFAEGVFRGGSASRDIYLRITQGIAGSPMPAATFVEGQFEQEDVWHLINFIRSLQTAEDAAQVSPKETASEATTSST